MPRYTKKHQTRKGNKYGAKKVKANGKTYDSQLEKYVADQLEWMKQAGEIESIEEQVSVSYYINGHKVTTNIIDFKCTMTNGETWYVEAKGKETDSYRIKKNLAIAMLDEIDPGCRYHLVKGKVGNVHWKELKLKRK